MVSSPSVNVAKRGPGRPRTSNVVNTVAEQLSTPDSAAKRGRGRPRKSDSNIVLDVNTAGKASPSNDGRSRRSTRTSDVTKIADRKTTLPPSTGSRHHVGRLKKASTSEVTVKNEQQKVYKSETRNDDSATEDSEDEHRDDEKAAEGTGSDKGKGQAQKDSGVKPYDVRKGCLTSTEAGTKRKINVVEAQENLIDSLDPDPNTTFDTATLRDVGQLPESGDINMFSSASNAISSTPRNFENGFNNESTAEGDAAYPSAKRPKLLPSPEFTAPVAWTHEGTPEPGYAPPSQPKTFHYGTGMDGSNAMHEDHTAMGLAHAALQNLHQVHEIFTSGDIIPGLQLTRAAGQNLGESFQPTHTQANPRPSHMANRVNNHIIAAPGGFVLTSSMVTYGGESGSRDDGMSNDVGDTVSSSVEEIFPSSSIVNADAGQYYGINMGGMVAPIAPMQALDGGYHVA